MYCVKSVQRSHSVNLSIGRIRVFSWQFILREKRGPAIFNLLREFPLYSFGRINEEHLRHERLQTRDRDGRLRAQDTRTAGVC